MDNASGLESQLYPGQRPVDLQDDANEQSRHTAAQKKADKFPVRLHYVLSEMEKDGLQHIAAWQTNGRCFFVHDKKLFTQCILPFWFRQSKFDSFQRQLNTYGFVRIASGPDKGGYLHELFIRGNIFLTEGIQRKSKSRPIAAQLKRASANNTEGDPLPASPIKNSKDTSTRVPLSSTLVSAHSCPPLELLHAVSPNANASTKSSSPIVKQQYERSFFPSLNENSCAMHTNTVSIEPRSYCVPLMNTWNNNLSLVDMLLQEFKSCHKRSSGPCLPPNNL